jgi:transposase
MPCSRSTSDHSSTRGQSSAEKNHYGSKSRRGTEVAAILYILVETAKLHGVDPTRYLLEAVRAADSGETLFPWRMLAST